MTTALDKRRSSRTTGDHKYVRLRHLLDRYIKNGDAGDPLPSYTQLREEYQVSQSTADRILQELVAEGRVVRKHGKGIFISRQAKQKSIALIFGDSFERVMPNLYPTLFLDVLRAHALEHDQRLLTFYGLPNSDEEADGDPSFRDLAAALRNKEIDGIVYGGYSRENLSLIWLAMHGVPIVSAGPLPELSGSEKFAYMASNGRDLVRMGVDALARQACRRIGLISLHRMKDQPDGPYMETVYFREAAGERGIACNPDWIWESCEYRPSGARYTVSEFEAAGYQALSALWRTLDAQGRRLEGIVVTDDFLTRGCIFAAAKLGLKIGKDIKIATHANKGSDALLPFEDDLALMEVEADGIADAMIHTLMLMMQGKPHEVRRLVGPRLKMPVNGGSEPRDAT